MGSFPESQTDPKRMRSYRRHTADRPLFRFFSRHKGARTNCLIIYKKCTGILLSYMMR